MTSFPEARALVLDHVWPLGEERVPLDEIGGRVLAQDLVCPFDIPQFDNSQVDGYAVRAEDGESPRWLAGVSAAGDQETPPVGLGEAVRVFTGAPIPQDANAVVMQEDTRHLNGHIELEGSPERGQFIRRQGEEIKQGTHFDLRARIATPPVVGLIASFGIAECSVFRRPKVSVVTTGNELIWPGEPLAPGQIYASNAFALASALRGLGIEDIDVSLVGDDPADTHRVLQNALDRTEVVITVGGVSVGDRDYVPSTLQRLGVHGIVQKVSMKPGKPFCFGTKGDRAVFGLPGNPVSALVTFQTLVRPALRKMMGLTEPEEETTMRLGSRIDRKDLRYEFLRATIKDGVATPVTNQGSHMQTGLAAADALLHIPDGVATIDVGSPVTVTPLRWGLS